MHPTKTFLSLPPVGSSDPPPDRVPVGTTDSDSTYVAAAEGGEAADNCGNDDEDANEIKGTNKGGEDSKDSPIVSRELKVVLRLYRMERNKDIECR